MNRPAAIFLVLFIFLATTLAASDAGSVAVLVLEHDEATLDAALRPAITDAAPLTRATAARVANVRNRTKLLDDLRAQLDRETDLTAAREEMRAVVMLGGGAEIDRALAVSDRFGKRLDSAVAVAVARLGPDVAVPAYFDKLRSRARIGDFFSFVLWGHPEMRSLLASKLIAAGDARGLSALLNDLDAAHDVDKGILIAALRTSAALRAAASEHLLKTESPIDERIRAALPDLPPPTGNVPLLADELLRRAAGVPHEHVDLTTVLRDERAASVARTMPQRVQDLLTRQERKVIAEQQLPGAIPAELKVPPERDFVLPSQLPEGLGAALLKESRCNAEWIGVIDVDVDNAGRVTAISPRNFDPPATCRQAAEAVLRLSLAEHPRFGAPRRSPVLMLHANKPDLCLDESPAGDAEVRNVGGEVKPPVAVHKVSPLYPASAMSAVGLGGYNYVVIQSYISKKGCVADEHLLKQTPFPELNASALLALDAWTFKPATLGGEPVDVIFNLTVQFKR